MRTIKFKVFNYDELSEEAKKSALDGLRSTVAEFLCECDSRDYESTLSEIEKAFGIKVYNWEVNIYGPTHYRWKFEDGSRWEQFDDGDMHGRRASLVKNNPKFLIRFVDKMCDHLLKGKYYSTPFRQCPKSPEHPAGLTNKTRFGKTVFNNPPFSCCLTGVYSDWAVDDAMNKCYEAVRAGHTIDGFIDDMLDAFFGQWEKDMEENYSDEAVIDHIEANEYEFLENGKMYCYNS